MADWADDKAAELLQYLFRCDGDDQRRTLIAAYLRVTKGDGYSEGFRRATTVVDEVFARHA